MAAEPIGMIGLGLMGTAMGSRLAAAGHLVVGYDVDDEACRAHARRAGHVEASPADVVRRCRVVVLSLPNGTVAAQACMAPDGVFAGASSESLLVDTTTSLPEEAMAMAETAARHGARFVDVGVSGNSAMVARGDALAVVGGSLADLSGVEKVLGAFCRRVMEAGGPGDGMRAKLVINHVLTMNRFALAEGLVHAEKVGMDPGRTLEILRESAASSRAMDMWGPRMVDGDFDEPASRVRGGDKDTGLILATGRRTGAPMLGLSQVDHVVQAVIANDLGDLDNAVIVEMLRRLGGIGRMQAPGAAS